MEHLYKLIKEERKKQGLNQAQMAKKMGMPARTYQRKEAGGLSLSEFVDLCKVLGLKLALLKEENIL